jgi:hypothetical protein
LRDRLKYAVGLSRFGLVLVVLVAVRIDLSFIVCVIETLKKMVDPVRLGKAQEKQKQRA